MEAILFDWDGTLVDSLGAFHAANSTVMAAFGLPFDVVVYRRHYVPDWREMYRRLGIPATGSTRRTACGRRRSLVRRRSGRAVSRRRPTRSRRLRDAGPSSGSSPPATATSSSPSSSAPASASSSPSGLRRRPPRPQAGPSAAPAGAASWRAGGTARRCRPMSATRRRTCGWRVAVGARAIGIESALGDPDELRAAGAAESRRRSRRGSNGTWRRGARERTVVTGAACPDPRGWQRRAGRRHRRAWPGWSDGVDLVIAADGGARHARCARRPDRPLGRRRRLDRSERELAALAAAGVAIDRAPATRTSPTPSWPSSPRSMRGARRLTILGALGGRAARPCARQRRAPRPSGARRPSMPGSSAPRTRIRLARAGAAPICAGRIGDLVSLLPLGGDAAGRHDRRPALSARSTSRCRSGPSRGLSNVRVDAAAAVSLRTGRLLVVETPATL